MKRRAAICCLLLILFCAYAPVEGDGYLVQLTKAQGEGVVWYICDITPNEIAKAMVFDDGEFLKATVMNCTHRID